MIKLIASDMDGTLLDENKNLPKKFPTLLSELKKRNITFIIASGRSYSALRPLFNGLGKSADDLIYICDNGANISIPHKEPVLDIIPPDVVKSVLYDCEKLGNVIPVLCCVNDIYYPSYAKEQFQSEITNFYKQFSTTDDMYKITDPVIKIAVCDMIGAMDNSYPVFAEKYPEMNVVVSGQYWMDIMNKGTDKGFALRKIKNLLSIKKDETMAFGDYFNDAPMLEESGMSYVMENACDEMKKYGKFIAKPNTENGVMSAICKELNINI
jgi:hypothetical protein